MLVFFIRHGETVDNVAGVYAGIRDSELTNHGILQARQLGDYLRLHRPPISAIFSSPLQRARKTAEAILSAQAKVGRSDGTTALREQPGERIGLIETPLLIEQDFGSSEGKTFFSSSIHSPKSGKASHNDIRKDDPGFKDVESKGSLNARADGFLDIFLGPLLSGLSAPDDVVVVVSHGILLSHLWRRFLLRLPRKSIEIAPEVTAAKGQLILEHLGGWSNTGFVEVKLIWDMRSSLPIGIGTGLDRESALRDDSAESASTTELVQVPENDETIAAAAPMASQPSATLFSAGAKLDEYPEASDAEDARRTRLLDAIAHPEDAHAPSMTGCTVTILTVNGQEHLRGVKRARGGIGSARFDEGQKTLHKFFKRADKPV